MPNSREIHLTINGRACRATVDVRTTLADALRDIFDCTSVHLGCEQGACGACTVLVDGHSMRSCLMLAVQGERSDITTLEGLNQSDGQLHPLQSAFQSSHALQCGFCTPGMILTAVELLQENPEPSPEQIREAISGNLCRCTGYQNIVAAIRQLSDDQSAKTQR
jgi:carbon-monoxide dehydrogenase small subunit